jgi:hypothetical protein
MGSATYTWPCCPPGYVIPTSPSSYSFYAFFRQDTLTKTNYILEVGNTSESLLCCYNFNIGDTLKTTGAGISCTGTSNFSCPSYSFTTVIKTDSLPVGNKKFKIYFTDTTNYVGYSGNNVKGMFLIEGLGNCYGLFSYYCLPFEGSIGLSSIYFDTVCTNLHILSLTNLNPSNSFIISPNPNNGSFVIEQNATTKQTVMVYDVNGKLVLSQTINGKTTIDATPLNEGVYNISMGSSEGVVNKRLVIVK